MYMTRAASPVLDDFGPIGLADLQAGAALLTRVDRKYVLPADVLPHLLRHLPAGTRVLEIDDRRRFGYRSDYLDTPGLDAYLGAARRRRRRFKVRVRTYLDNGDRFAEVKTRGPRGVTVKDRTPIEFFDVDARRYVDLALAAAGVAACGGVLGPALSTRYDRSTLYLPGSGTRVTIDTDLSWSLPDGSGIDLPGRVVVETKTALRAGSAGSAAGSAAGEVDRLLWRLGHRPCAMSKYGTGMAALRADLPANRWLPVLRRHFPSPASARAGASAGASARASARVSAGAPAGARAFARVTDQEHR